MGEGIRNMKRATKKQTSVAYNRSLSIVKKIRKSLKEQNKAYKFTELVVGSRAFNTILLDDSAEEPYDIDIRLILTTNSREKDADKAWQDFKVEFEKLADENLEVNANGTRAIKCIQKNQGIIQYKLEYVLVKDQKEADNIIEKNKPNNVYEWHLMKKKYSEAYTRFDNYGAQDKTIIIENYILPLKIDERSRGGEKSSISLFIEGLNNYENEQNNKK